MARALIALFVLVTLCTVSPAWGDREEPLPPPLIAPRAWDAGVVPYPAGAHGDAVVVLELLVGIGGEISEARVADGAGAAALFTDAALVAARLWRFEPARRGDFFVRARVRMRVEFHAPPAPNEEDAKPDPSAGTGTSAVRPAPAKLEEVKVRGARHEAGQTSL